MRNSPAFLGALASLALLPPPLVAEEVIADNSFFIEEAYNQEAGVVQHIQTLAWDDDSESWAWSFTQEWPVGSMTHQLSYTVPYTWLESPHASGVGDVLVHYRWQALASERTAVAPRLSVVLPTGNENKELGGGSWGLQANLPLSHRLAERWVAHGNLGATWLAAVETPGQSGRERSLTSPFAGASLIWLYRPNLNFLLEAVATSNASLAGDGEVERTTSTVVSPGLRWAIDRGDLQIVPGIALPITFEGGGSSPGVLLYLSFEHPFNF